MRRLNSFEEYLKEGIARKVTIDTERAESLILEAERRFNYLHKKVTKMGVDQDNANDYVEHCYDLLSFLVRAKMYREGYSSSGPGAHEAEMAFARNMGCSEREVQFLNELRFFRNGILYYGRRMDQEYAQKVIAFTKNTYGKLKVIASKGK